MHQVVARALEEIDAAVFSGDTFSTEGRDLAMFKDYLARWLRAIPDLENALIAFTLEEELEHGEE